MRSVVFAKERHDAQHTPSNLQAKHNIIDKTLHALLWTHKIQYKSKYFGILFMTLYRVSLFTTHASEVHCWSVVKCLQKRQENQALGIQSKVCVGPTVCVLFDYTIYKKEQALDGS